LVKNRQILEHPPALIKVLVKSTTFADLFFVFLLTFGCVRQTNKVICRLFKVRGKCRN